MKRIYKNYCWWFRTPANQLRLVVYPIIYSVFMHLRWYRISEPSTGDTLKFAASPGWWYSFTGGLVGLVLKRLRQQVIQKTDPQKTHLSSHGKKRQRHFLANMFQFRKLLFFLHFGRVILLMEEILHHLTSMKPCKSCDTVNYQPQLVSRISEPSTVSWVWKRFYSHFAVSPTLGLQGWESSLLCIALVATLSSETMQWKVVWRFWWQESKNRQANILYNMIQ